MYRSHLGTLPDENWQFNSDTETFLHFFNMTVVFQSWAFYRKTLMEEAYKMGWPVARHMFLVFPNNSVTYTNPHVRFQFMLGTELLVAPVFKEGSSTVKVFLPTNTTWIHVWTNKIYKGMTKLSSLLTSNSSCTSSSLVFDVKVLYKHTILGSTLEEKGWEQDYPANSY